MGRVDNNRGPTLETSSGTVWVLRASEPTVQKYCPNVCTYLPPYLQLYVNEIYTHDNVAITKTLSTVVPRILCFTEMHMFIFHGLLNF